MKNVFVKEFIREIKGNKGRFFSIFFIVLFGSAFFSGIRSSGGDMKYSADVYFDDSNMMDIRVISTLGLTDDDLEAIGEIADVESVVGGYTTDALMSTGEHEYCVKLIAETQDVNKLDIIEGRDVQSEDECVVDDYFMESLGYEIGDTISLYSGSDEELSDAVDITRFTIVGTGNLPYYIDLSRGVSSIGDGSLDGFIVIQSDVFNLDYYTEAYVTVDGAKDLESYSDEYTKLVETAADAIEDISDDAKQRRYEELGKLSMPEWYVLDRDDISSCYSYGNDAERIDNIGKLFPVIFFLVAALVSLTAMTRMAEEQRSQIGTLKALGYSNRAIAGKYTGYAMLATLGGAIIGMFIGEYLLPKVIMIAYGMLYVGIPAYYMPINVVQGLLAIFISAACTGIAAVSSVYNLLRENPASLMRPEAPKSGRRIFVEHIAFIWERLNFTQKSTLRNLFRYKKRFVMTIIGIGGCMGLMLVGFGLRDSIQVVAQNQYTDIFMQDVTLSIDADADVKALEDAIEGYEGVTDSLDVYMLTVTLGSADADREAYLYVPKDTDEVLNFVSMRDRTTKQEYTFPSEGAALSEKTADMLGVSVGDEITIQEGEDSEKVTVRVCDIIENYVLHYAFISPETYEKLYYEEPEYNTIYLKCDDTSSAYETKLGNTLLKYDACTGVSFTTELEQKIDDMLRSLYLVIIVLIVAAALLAFVVLYNLNSINMTERKRELATLKVLGFYNSETAMYLYRENIILTIIGIATGIVIGRILHLFTITTVEVDKMMFGRVIEPESYVLGALLTLAFSFLVNIMMLYHIKKIDMVESLKSVE